MAKRKYDGPQRTDGYLLHKTESPSVEYRAIMDDGMLDVYTFVEGREEGDRLYGISENITAGLRRMFREWDAAGR